jgi:hypothetical protein
MSRRAQHHEVRPHLRDGLYSAYEVAVRVHLIPGLGAHKLNKLEPEHLERFYEKMQKNGASAGTAHQAHRTIRTALGEAEKRGALTADNPAEKAKPPLGSVTAGCTMLGTQRPPCYCSWASQIEL